MALIVHEAIRAGDDHALCRQTSYASDGVDWPVIVEKLDFAFQPIVNIHTGVCLGCEALVRNWAAAGFSSIGEMFDAAYLDGQLAFFELLLREKAVRKYLLLPQNGRIILFLNLDNRILANPDELCENFSGLVSACGLEPGMICLEISEQQPIDDYEAFCGYCRKRRTSQLKVAIDDFGSGFSGLQLLYYAEPNFVKIDRFFINDIATDAKKKLFVAKVVDLAHILGSMVIAEGVETEREYFACKEIGCDYVQGYLIQKPTVILSDIRLVYEEIAVLGRKDRRGNDSDEKILAANIEYIPPVVLEPDQYTRDGLEIVLKKFRQNKERTFFPLLNPGGEPLGIIREKFLKDYVYTQYGRNLLLNKSLCKNVQNFVSFCPVMEKTLSIEKLLEVFSLTRDPEGIILTSDGRYVGFLTSAAIIKILHEKNLSLAREQNPLSKMPGNSQIVDYLARAYTDVAAGYGLVYFDFNDFKPFNDHYGFRRGDRAILMFADLLKNSFFATDKENFAGHLGGDDFFAGAALAKGAMARLCSEVEEIIDKFNHAIATLYDHGEREQGFILATDRNGEKKRFGLLSLSAAVLLIEAGPRLYTMEDVSRSIAILKRTAKGNLHSRFAIARMGRSRRSPLTLVENACQGCLEKGACRLAVDRHLLEA
ncbi:MAG: GGDEF domain-containing protein [Thermodesulfobacteriota bacterium]